MSCVGHRKQSILWKKSKGLCHYCGVGLRHTDPNKLSANDFTVDHIIPSAIGGTSKLNNLVACCRRCNSQKGMNDIEGFRWIKMKRKFENENDISFSDRQYKWLYNNGLSISMYEHIFFFEEK